MKQKKAKSSIRQQKLYLKPMDGPVSLALIHIDSLFEKITNGKIKLCDDSNIFQLRKLNLDQLKELNSHFRLTIANMKLALTGDEFYKEAYSNFNLQKLKIALEYLNKIKFLTPDINSTGKKIRISNKKTKEIFNKPKKIRKSLKEFTVDKVLYMTTDENLSITSIDPRQIFGATELWIYNVKTRKLGCFYAKDEKGLSINGSTIVDYNEEKSMVKNVRHPEKQVFEFMQGGIRWMRGYWNELIATAQPIPCRITKDVLLLKVHK